MDEPEIAQSLVVRPGDVLILRYAPSVFVSKDDYDMIKARVQDHCPGIADVMIVSCAELGVYRAAD